MKKEEAEKRSPPSWGALSIAGIQYRSSTEYPTGDWGVNKPVIDRKKCTQCSLCHFLCPEGAINIDEHGSPVHDYDFCKGCGICATECPTKCIAMEKK